MVGKGKPPLETRFKKGVSGNPAGRPKSNLGKLLAKYMEKTPAGLKETYAELFVKKCLKLALEDGDVEIIKYIWDRLEGKIPQDVEFGGKDNTPMKFTLSIGEREA